MHVAGGKFKPGHVPSPRPRLPQAQRPPQQPRPPPAVRPPAPESQVSPPPLLKRSTSRPERYREEAPTVPSGVKKRRGSRHNGGAQHWVVPPGTVGGSPDGRHVVATQYRPQMLVAEPSIVPKNVLRGRKAGLVCVMFFGPGPSDGLDSRHFAWLKQEFVTPYLPSMAQYRRQQIPRKIGPEAFAAALAEIEAQAAARPHDSGAELVTPGTSGSHQERAGDQGGIEGGPAELAAEEGSTGGGRATQPPALKLTLKRTRPAGEGGGGIKRDGKGGAGGGWGIDESSKRAMEELERDSADRFIEAPDGVRRERHTGDDGVSDLCRAMSCPHFMLYIP
eukprot:jgi/Mesen1/576/ME000107S10817